MTTQHLNHFGVVQGLMQFNHRLGHAGQASVGRPSSTRTSASLRPQDVTNICPRVRVLSAGVAGTLDRNDAAFRSYTLEEFEEVTVRGKD